MLIKIAIFGTLAYAGYKFVQSQGGTQASSDGGARQVRLAGGPLSEHASVQRSADNPPPFASPAAG